MKKSVYTGALVSGALFAASSVALAVDKPSPELTLPEKGAFTLIEQSLSLVAALIDRQGCTASTGAYTLGGESIFNGDGTVTVDDVTIAASTALDDFRGTEIHTTIPTPGEIDDIDFMDLYGVFHYAREGEIMYADADFELCVSNCAHGYWPGKEPYDEHVIKDFYADPHYYPERYVVDKGLEVITKDDYPRMKYRQTSRYLPPDGGVGYVWIDKVSIAPNNAPQCMLQYHAVVDDYGSGIQFQGTLYVYPLY